MDNANGRVGQSQSSLRPLRLTTTLSTVTNANVAIKINANDPPTILTQGKSGDQPFSNHPQKPPQKFFPKTCTLQTPSPILEPERKPQQEKDTKS